MTQTATALYNFASSFGWDAYPEYSVSNGAALPYITYTLQEYEWDTVGTMQMRLWSKDTSYTAINQKIDLIEERLNESNGVPTPSGSLYIYKGSPWCQFQPSDEPDLKIAYLNFDVHYTTN